MTFSFQTILQLLILFQSFFFAAFLILSNQGKKASNLILAILLSIIGIQMGGFILLNIGYSNILINFNCAFGFIYGPLVFIYTRSLIFKNYKLKRIDFLHCLAFIAIITLGVLNIDICQTEIYFLYFISILLYVYLSSKEIDRYRKILLQTQSDYERQNLSWLKLNLTLFVIVISADFVQLFSNLFFSNITLTSVFEIIVFFTLLIFISMMVFKGLIQPEIFSGINREDEGVAKLSNIKYSYSKLSTIESKAILKLLKQVMISNKPFLESSLSLADLATILDVPPRHLSQVINEHFQQNFLEYINSKRIEESMQLLANPTDEKETIQEIMYSVGFNSKSAFYNAFKKQTGLNPSQFKIKHS